MLAIKNTSSRHIPEFSPFNLMLYCIEILDPPLATSVGYKDGVLRGSQWKKTDESILVNTETLPQGQQMSETDVLFEMSYISGRRRRSVTDGYLFQKGMEVILLHTSCQAQGR